MMCKNWEGLCQQKGKPHKYHNAPGIAPVWIMGLPHSFWCWEIINDHAQLTGTHKSFLVHSTSTLQSFQCSLGNLQSFSLFCIFWCLSLPFWHNFQDVFFSIDMKSLCVFCHSSLSILHLAVFLMKRRFIACPTTCRFKYPIQMQFLIPCTMTPMILLVFLYDNKSMEHKFSWYLQWSCLTFDPLHSVPKTLHFCVLLQKRHWCCHPFSFPSNALCITRTGSCSGTQGQSTTIAYLACYQ